MTGKAKCRLFVALSKIMHVFDSDMSTVEPEGRSHGDGIEFVFTVFAGDGAD
jgi:hypothetical protein